MKIVNKKLYRSNTNKVVFGVMGGFGEYFDVDPVILRVAYIFLSVFTAFFPGVFAYILMAIVMPKKSEILKEKSNISE
ncbi:MAG: PspC domain-containing protein [bacterium]